MKYTETEIEGVWLIEPRVFDDARGYFFEAWKQAALRLVTRLAKTML